MDVAQMPADRGPLSGVLFVAEALHLPENGL